MYFTYARNFQMLNIRLHFLQVDCEHLQAFWLAMQYLALF